MLGISGKSIDGWLFAVSGWLLTVSGGCASPSSGNASLGDGNGSSGSATYETIGEGLGDGGGGSRAPTAPTRGSWRELLSVLNLSAAQQLSTSPNWWSRGRGSRRGGFRSCWPLPDDSLLYAQHLVLEGMFTQTELQGRSIDLKDFAALDVDAYVAYLELKHHGHLTRSGDRLIPTPRRCCGQYFFPWTSGSRFFAFQPLLDALFVSAFRNDTAITEDRFEFLLNPQDRTDAMQEAVRQGFLAKYFDRGYFVVNPPAGLPMRNCELDTPESFNASAKANGATNNGTDGGATEWRIMLEDLRRYCGLEQVPWLIILWGITILCQRYSPSTAKHSGSGISREELNRHFDRIIDLMNVPLHSKASQSSVSRTEDPPSQLETTNPETDPPIAVEIAWCRPKCFLHSTAFKRPNGDLVRASLVKKGDVLQRIGGGTVSVCCEPLLHEVKAALVEITTDQPGIKIKITRDHRLSVPAADGERVPRLAGTMKKGEFVMVGSRKQKVTNIKETRELVTLVQVHLFPDLPVEAFNLPSFGVHAYGSLYDLRTVFQNTSAEELLQAQVCAELLLQEP